MVATIKNVPSDYILVIAEKPKAAEKIANALGNAEKYYIDKVPIWIVRRNGEYYVVASAVGHMYSLYTDEKGYPTYNYRWVPRYLVDEGAKHVKKFLKVLSTLARNAKAYVNACDYDIEGSVIGYLIIKHHGDEKKAFRAKFSSLVKHEIIKAIENLSKLDYEMIEAGICRHILDWLWGINVSRALMDIYTRIFKTWRVLSAGRVQTPTLAYAVDLILQRRLYVPKPLAHPSIRVKIGNKIYYLEPLDPPFTSAISAKNYINKVREQPKAYVEGISTNTILYRPPHPFNLPDLQSEAYRILKISPYKTQRLAEDLYLEALISYPRTNSQKLPHELDHKRILRGLALNPIYKPLVEKLITETKGILKPNNGPKDDPAHPAIHPTGEGDVKGLSREHLRLYDLIVRRYLASFAFPAKVEYTEVILQIHGRRYALRGTRVLERGWFNYYPYVHIEDKYIPVNLLSKGLQIPVADVKLTIRYTQPPKSPTRFTLLKWMEDVGIGTEATRAEIIETLFKRGYLYSRSRYIDVSDLAVALVYILRSYVKELVSVDLTREFETLLKDIMFGRVTCTTIEEKAKIVIDEHIQSIKKNLDSIIYDVYKYVEITNQNADNLCRICKRAIYKDGLCLFHYEALDKVKNGYDDWRKFGYTWEKYVRKLCKLKSSGIYVKDVCRYLISNE